MTTEHSDGAALDTVSSKRSSTPAGSRHPGPTRAVNAQHDHTAGGRIDRTRRPERIHNHRRPGPAQAPLRQQLLEAAQLERHRLERDLHDGAQQCLVGLAITLGLAERQLERDPEMARESLIRARAELAQALTELRELACGLHPAVLTESGLDAALSALAARAALPVALSVDLDHRPPEPVEAAAYFTVAESLTNIARHASAGNASVTVRRHAANVLVEVTDDGQGGADPTAGTGLRGLIDRVEALGGRLAIQSRRGRGTTIQAWLPEREDETSKPRHRKVEISR